MMGTIRDAITWSGSDAMLSVFVVTAARAPLQLDWSVAKPPPIRVRTYPMEDVEGVLGDRTVHEHDAVFTDVPDELEAVLESLSTKAIEDGASAVWLGFEGSFSFDFLLSPEIAAQIYAVADADGVAVARDVDLRSDAWATRVAQARRRLLADG